jgi:hypothetical protein
VNWRRSELPSLEPRKR